MDEPVRVPGGPVGIHPVGDPVNLMMGLAGLVQEFGDLRLGVTHGHTSLSIESLLCFLGKESSEVGGQRQKHRKRRRQKCLVSVLFRRAPQSSYFIEIGRLSKGAPASLCLAVL